eukprot:scaffold27758_cov112-Isochrysis_galbana.AAC.1
MRETWAGGRAGGPSSAAGVGCTGRTLWTMRRLTRAAGRGAAPRTPGRPVPTCFWCRGGTWPSDRRGVGSRTCEGMRRKDGDPTEPAGQGLAVPALSA